MNSAPPSLPGLLMLYNRDFTIGRAMRATVFGLIVAGGMYWAFQSTPTLAPGAEQFEANFAGWMTIGGLTVAVLGAIVMTRRYLWVKKVLARGATVKGVIEDLESHEVGGKRDSTGKIVTRHAYYATIRYEMHGRDRQVRIKLPYSGFVLGLTNGGEADLFVHDSAPDKPLLRAIYLGRS